MKRLVLTFLLLGLAHTRFLAMTQDWPQWRGPHRDGIITSPVHADWPEQLKQRWQVVVGAGHSSPLLVNQRVYLLTRQGDQEVVSCIGFDTGKILWQDKYPAPYTMNRAATSHGKGPKSTPVFDSGRVFTFGISGILSSYDAGSGRLRWRKAFADQFTRTSPLYGASMSPLVDKGLLIVHVGGHDGGALIALSAETGERIWSWGGDGPGYASPIIAELAGVRQVVTQTQSNLIGVSAADGKLLWQIPFTTAYVQNIITPISRKQTLIFSGLDKGVFAVSVNRSSGKWKTDRIWENTDVSFYMSTPVLAGDVLFGLSHKRRGQIVALDAQTGRTLWATEGRGGEYAAVLGAGERLIFLTNDAELIVAKASRAAYEQLRRYTVAKSPTWAHPVVAGKRILVKDAETLTSWSMD